MGRGIIGQDEVNLASVQAVETDVELAVRRPCGMVFPAWPMEFGNALHSDDELESHRAGLGAVVWSLGGGIGRQSGATATGGSPTLDL
jgi:hypothetical protein